MFQGIVQIDDAYFCGELSVGKAGRGSENKVSFVAAVELNENRRPVRIMKRRVSGFTLEAIKDWAEAHVVPGSTVFPDGVGCSCGAAEASCKHVVEVAGGRKPKDIPSFQWLNTILRNVKIALSGAYHAFDFKKYEDRYLAEIVYRFNRRFNLMILPQRLLIACLVCRQLPEPLLRSAELCC